MTEKTIFAQSIDYIQQKGKDILHRSVSSEELLMIDNLFLEANRIFVYGAGRSGLVAKAFAIRLVHLGFQTFVIGETIGAPVKKGDLTVIVTGSGETIPTVMTAEIAHKIGVKVLVIAGKKDSRVLKFADLSVVLSAECDEPERKQLAPLGTLFEASAWIFLDGLVSELMERKGETEKSMQLRHATLE
ncbi:MAG: SIS domain-containing protein [Euryarchaeota archaeon]|nr:SIS domain-containing protein [Euryarchaeota archaeon]